MKLSDLSSAQLREQLARGDLVIQAGPFAYRLQSELPAVRAGLGLLYADYPLRDADVCADFSIQLGHGRGLHRWIRQQVCFSADGEHPFEPLPLSHALPQMEWGMNWCVASRADQYLLLHAAVLERQGCALVLAAPPGSGKSTLCAALLHRGWRLLSDELGLVSLDGCTIHPAVRPVSLKNQSLALIQAFEPAAVMGPVTPDTSKGAVGHMQVPRTQVARMHEAARPRWLVFPKYEAGAALSLTPHAKAHSALELAGNAFNYVRLGVQGFEALCQLVDASDCFRLRYAHLDDANQAFDRLAEEAV